MVKGTILGTLHYMAPEQVEGKEADGRSDIWALGAVLYEMAAGKRPFDGESPSSVMAAILRDQPPAISPHQQAAPAALVHIVRTSLAKDPDDRWQNAGDVARQLRWIAQSGGHTLLDASKRSGNLRNILFAVGAVAALIVAAAVFASRASNQSPTADLALRLALAPPNGTSFGRAVALSPDGRSLAFVATTAGQPALWVRALNALEGRPIAGTEGASLPFWSPDNRSIGFFAGGKLKTVEATGSPPVTLCDAYAGRGGTWAADGTIIYAPGFADPLYRIAASGGDPKPLTTLDLGRGDTAHLWPWILPDQRHFLFLVRSQRPEYQGIHVGSVDSPSDRVRLADADSNALYRPGYLLFARGQSLMAQPFDSRAFTLNGNAITVAEGLLHTPGGQNPATFSVSDNGTLVYGSGSASTLSSKFAWVDRGGNVINRIGDSRPYTHMALSPDGHHVAVLVSGAAGVSHIWSNVVPDADVAPFTFGQANDVGIVWSPTGTELMWASARPVLGLYKKPANGSGSEQLMWRAPVGATTAREIQPTDWSPDGQHVLFQNAGKGTGWDLWALSLFGDGQARPLIQTPSDDGQGKFSPDGQWVAYASNESGRLEVYVQQFPPTGVQRRVSVAGGMLPQWRSDGRELFFLVPNSGRMMAADVAVTAANFQSKTPHFLFQLPTVLTHGSEAGGHYGVAPDGQRLLVQLSDESPVQSLNLVVNWTSDLVR